jgi:transposase-like protein
MPRVVTTDKNAAYPTAIKDLKDNVNLNINTKFRQIKYLNNIVE